MSAAGKISAATVGIAPATHPILQSGVAGGRGVGCQPATQSIGRIILLWGKNIPLSLSSSNLVQQQSVSEQALFYDALVHACECCSKKTAPCPDDGDDIFKFDSLRVCEARFRK